MGLSSYSCRASVCLPAVVVTGQAMRWFLDRRRCTTHAGPRQSPAKTLLSRRRSTAGPIAIAIAAAGGGAEFAVAGAIATVADEPRASRPDVV